MNYFCLILWASFLGKTPQKSKEMQQYPSDIGAGSITVSISDAGEAGPPRRVIRSHTSRTGWTALYTRYLLSSSRWGWLTGPMNLRPPAEVFVRIKNILSLGEEGNPESEQDKGLGSENYLNNLFMPNKIIMETFGFQPCFINKFYGGTNKLFKYRKIQNEKPENEMFLTKTGLQWMRCRSHELTTKSQ